MAASEKRNLHLWSIQVEMGKWPWLWIKGWGSESRCRHCFLSQIFLLRTLPCTKIGQLFFNPLPSCLLAADYWSHVAVFFFFLAKLCCLWTEKVTGKEGSWCISAAFPCAGWHHLPADRSASAVAFRAALSDRALSSGRNALYLCPLVVTSCMWLFKLECKYIKIE